MTIDRNAQINVVLNSSDPDGTEINLGRVFQTMKSSRRVYAWVLALCIFVGVCSPLLLYLASKHALTVASVVTLNYDVVKEEENPTQPLPEAEPVKDLTAPDGTPLDLSQLLSSYVLQNAIKDVKLSCPISISALRSNLKIDRMLTEDSRQAQELAAKMAADNNPNVFSQIQSVPLTYSNKFVVSLENGFDNGNGKKEFYLADSELRLVLDRILSAYNDYLILTYASIRLPEDELSIIDLEHLDILESLEQMRTAADDLNTYCQDQPDAVKAYRSWKTGLSLNDWILALQTEREVTVDYLYSYIYTNGIVKDRDAMLLSYEYQLRNAQSELDAMNKNIETVNSILQSYKKDNIFVSMQESDTSKSTSTATDYYNELILSQAKNYTKVADMEIRISNLIDKINVLRSSNENTLAEIAAQEEIDQELSKTLEGALRFYNQVKAHMEEVQASSQFTNYALHTAAQGKLPGLLQANLKNMIIGLAAGAVIGCGLWFGAAVLPEFTKSKKQQNENLKEAEA